MKKILVFLLITYSATSQLHEVAETQLFLQEDKLDKIDVLVASDFILVLNDQENYYGNQHKIIALTYDTNLNLKNTLEFNVEKFYEPVSFKLIGENLYYLFRELESKKVQLVIFDLNLQELRSYKFETITGLTELNFEISGGHPLIYGVYNNKPVVEMHKLGENTGIVLSDIYQKNNELKTVIANPYRNEIYVITSLANSCKIQVATYDEIGKLLYRTALGDNKHHIIQLDLKFGIEGNPFIMGTYNSNCQDSAEGLFSGSLDLPKSLKYQAFSELSSYKASLSPKKARKINLKINRGKTHKVRQRAIFYVPYTSLNSFLAVAELYSFNTASGLNESSKKLSYKNWKILLAEMEYMGDINENHLVKLEGDAFSELVPNAAFLLNNNQYYSFLPSRNHLVYANMNTTATERYTLQFPPHYKINDIEIKLLNHTPNNFFAHGFADIKIGENSLNTKQIYFIKKLSLN